MTTGGTGDEAARIASAVSDAVERVFATVAQVHAAAVRALRGPAGSVAPSGPARRELDEDLQELLQAPDQLAVGLGLVVAPRPERGLPLGLHWWQRDPAADRLRALEPDLRPSSLGYYDYEAADWFDVPRRTGRRHVVGPYVDVHGTGRYLLTLTGPVLADGEFLGVVGADVPVSRFEAHLLDLLGSLRRPFVLLDGERRVVLSTSPRRLVGDRVPADAGPAGPGAVVPGTPWQLHVLGPSTAAAR